MTEPDATPPFASASDLGHPEQDAPAAGLIPVQPPVASVSTYPLSFTGNATEYFRIWIVNVALSIVTLGFYTPWARVRTRQYFYGNTWLDGHNFEYTANPLALLRGYLIVLGFALTYWLSVQFSYQGSEYVVGLLLLLFVGLYPWLVRQSMRFLAQSTVHRGIRFRFTGSLSDSYLAYGVANIAGALSLGLAWPWAWFMQRNYQVSGLAYGSAQGRFRGNTGGFYLIALAGLGLSLGVGLLILLIVVLGAVIFAGALDSPSEAVSNAGFVGLALVYFPAVLLYLAAGQYVRNAVMTYVLDNVELGGVVRLATTLSPWRLVWISVTNTLAQLVSLGLLTPWATVRRTRYILEHTQVRAIRSLDEFTAVNTSQETALGEAATELLDINIGF